LPPKAKVTRSNRVGCAILFKGLGFRRSDTCSTGQAIGKQPNLIRAFQTHLYLPVFPPELSLRCADDSLGAGRSLCVRTPDSISFSEPVPIAPIVPISRVSGDVGTGMGTGSPARRAAPIAPLASIGPRTAIRMVLRCDIGRPSKVIRSEPMKVRRALQQGQWPASRSRRWHHAASGSSGLGE
jgi:hypothetical protein